MLAALLVLVTLDSMKTELKRAHQTPYSAARLPVLSPGPLGDAARKLLASGKKGPPRYATAEELYGALLGETTIAAELAAGERAVRNQYAKRIGDVDREIGDALLAQSAAEQPDEAKKLAGLKSQLNDLAALRAAQLAEVQQKAAGRKAELLRMFEESRLAKTAAVPFAFFGNPALDPVAERVADPDHPLSIIYDVLWYASLVVGVLAFIALLLKPLFSALPVAGANDTFMDQIRGVFGRAPRAVGGGAVRLAALTAIGAAAIVSVATTAPSSPLYESGMVPPAQQEAQNKTSDAKTADDAAAKPPAKPEPNPPAADPRIDTLMAAVEHQRQTLDTHEQTLGSHKQILDAVHDLPGRVATLTANENQQVSDLHGRFQSVDTRMQATRDVADSAEVKAEFATSAAKAVSAQVQEAGKQIDRHARQIDEGVSLPYQVGERPSAVRSLFGFDQYRVTDASVKYG